MAVNGVIATDADGTLVAFGNVTLVADVDGGGGSGGANLFSQTQVVSVDTTAAETTLVGTGIGTAQVAANTWGQGEVLHGKASGIYGTLATNPGNVTINLVLGSTTTHAFTITPVAAQSNQPWEINYAITRLSTGGSGTIRGTAWLKYQENLSEAIEVGVGMTGAVTLASDAIQTVAVKADWQTSSASNAWVCYQNYFQIIGTDV